MGAWPSCSEGLQPIVEERGSYLARGHLKPVDFSMSVTTLTTPQTGTIPARRKFTIIPRLDENPKLVAQAQTAAGKIAVIAMAVCLIGWRRPRPIVFLVAVALVSFLPAYRRMVLAAAVPFFIRRQNDGRDVWFLRSRALQVLQQQFVACKDPGHASAIERNC